MAASLFPRASRALHLVLNGYVLRPQHQVRAFCKIPPDDEKSNAEKQEQTEGGSMTALEVEKPLLEERPQPSQMVQEVCAGGEGGKLKEGKLTSQKAVERVIEEDQVAVKQSLPEEKLETAKDKRASAQKKLNDLLKSLASADPMPVEPPLKLSKPKARQKKPINLDIQDQDSEPPQPDEPVIEPELLSATREVAESLGGDVAATESELLSTLRSHTVNGSNDGKSSIDWSDLFVGMKVERTQSKPAEALPRRRRHHQDPSAQRTIFGDGVPNKKSLPRTITRPDPRTLARVDIFGAECLGIFTGESSKVSKSAVPASSSLVVWEAARKRELQQCVYHPPDNSFTEMIQWTKQGKLWVFPIDNEVGLEEEKSVGFHEHVFLGHHLDGWCPQRGPIRHFMELVCTGLSKNPYMTVERKRAHLEWYKNYFKEKEELLKELGAIEATP